MEITVADLRQSLQQYNNRSHGLGSYERPAVLVDTLLLYDLTQKILYEEYSFEFKTKTIVNRFNKRIRDVQIMSITDYIVQKTAVRLFDSFFPHFFSDSVYAYRTGKGPSQLVKELYYQINTNNYDSLLRLDIVSYIDSIDVPLLKQMVYQIEDVTFRGLLLNYLDILPKKKLGIPPGSIFSNFILNFYLRSFDEYVLDEPDIVYYRYVDDLFVLFKKRISAVDYFEKYQKYLSINLKLKIHSLNYSKSGFIDLQNNSISFYYYTLGKNGVFIKEDLFAHLFAEIKLIVDSKKDLESAINSINYYFCKSYQWRDYQSDCFFLVFSPCTNIKQFNYIDREIRKILFRKFKGKNDVRSIRQSLISTRRLYFEVKKKQLHYQLPTNSLT